MDFKSILERFTQVVSHQTDKNKEISNFRELLEAKREEDYRLKLENINARIMDQHSRSMSSSGQARLEAQLQDQANKRLNEQNQQYEQQLQALSQISNTRLQSNGGLGGFVNINAEDLKGGPTLETNDKKPSLKDRLKTLL